MILFLIFYDGSNKYLLVVRSTYYFHDFYIAKKDKQDTSVTIKKVLNLGLGGNLLQKNYLCSIPYENYLFTY